MFVREHLKKGISLMYAKSINRNPNKFYTLLYSGKPSIIITHFLQKFNSNFSIKRNKSFRKNNGGKTNNEKSGVNKLGYDTCDKVYFGQTGRAFKTRINEHFSNYFHQHQESNYANHPT